VRLRLLNAANARFFDLSFSDRRAMHLVASDLGLLPRPVELERLRLAPGQRAEVLVDFAAGAPDVELVSYADNNAAMGMGGGFTILPPAFAVLAFRAEAALPASGGRIPAAIVAEDQPRRAPARSRSFTLNDPAMGPAMMRGGGMMHAINGQSFAMDRLDFTVPIGTTERWTVDATAMSHPFHVHGVRIRVLSENGGAPRPENTGWKDTVVIDRRAELLVEFDQPATRDKPFMLHCHILEHEDTGMMQQFAVA
jgi:FtsP/CotA-like multicopper oxidase with cupredoxin domain